MGDFSKFTIPVERVPPPNAMFTNSYIHMLSQSSNITISDLAHKIILFETNGQEALLKNISARVLNIDVTIRVVKL